MKTALVLALFGALFALSYAGCPTTPYYACVKEDKPTKCKAIQVCEQPVKEQCGHKYCEYPHVCASLKRKECYNFLDLKKKCEPKRTCKAVHTPCGHGYCTGYQECVKETVCKVKGYGGYGRKLKNNPPKAKALAAGLASTKDAAAGGAAFASSDNTAKATLSANADDKTASVRATAEAGKKGSHGGYPPYYHPGHGDHYGDHYGGHYGDYAPEYHSYGYDKKSKCDYNCDKLVCEDKYTCVAKEPCKEIVLKKCVKSEYKPGIDVCHGGYHFDFFSIKSGEMCGHEYCGHGYECANVYVQQCNTKCGHEYCGYGYECAYEEAHYDECKDYGYLATICKDVYEPVCVHLPYHVISDYKPPCKTIYKCETEDSVCGDDYCPYGYVCAIDYKKTCGVKYHGPYHGKVVEKPKNCGSCGYKHGRSSPYYNDHYYAPHHEEPHYYGPSKKDGASVDVTAKADKDGAKATLKADVKGEGAAGGYGASTNGEDAAAVAGLAYVPPKGP